MTMQLQPFTLSVLKKEYFDLKGKNNSIGRPSLTVLDHISNKTLGQGISLTLFMY